MLRISEREYNGPKINFKTYYSFHMTDYYCLAEGI